MYEILSAHQVFLGLFITVMPYLAVASCRTEKKKNDASRATSGLLPQSLQACVSSPELLFSSPNATYT